jgi:peptidylprolyl isomerase
MQLGDGLEVAPGNVVVAHYHGTLRADPSVRFDSSFERGEPVALPLSYVIPGWQKGVPGMRVGGIRRLTIPAALAYGDRSPSPQIPANSDLVFILQIVDVMQIEDVVVGKGDPVGGRWVALTTFTVRDQNGKILEQHDSSDPYLLVRSEYQAMAFGLEGMMRGGKRRLTVPAALNRSDPAFGANRVDNIPVTIEVELLNLKLIPPDGDAPGC